MKLTLETYGKTFTVEAHEGANIDEYFDIIIGLLYQATFTEKTIQKAIIELADSYNGE
jgi:hypothetical protein